jgi:hypothetical protein
MIKVMLSFTFGQASAGNLVFYEKSKGLYHFPIPCDALNVPLWESKLRAASPTGEREVFPFICFDSLKIHCQSNRRNKYLITRH